MAKPSLFELQRWLAWKITGEQGFEPAPKCGEWIADEPSNSRQARLQIYVHAYLARLVKSLKEDYPAVARLLGEKRFSKLIEEYMAHFPSTSASLADLGRNLPAFLLLHEVSADHPCLFEVGTFEWALCEALYTNPGPKFDPSPLRDVPEAILLQSRLHLDPSVRLYNFEFPVPDIWKGAPPAGLQRTYVTIYRSQGGAGFETLSPAEFRLLRLFQQGASLEAAIEDSGLSDPGAVFATFSRWGAAGIINRIDFEILGCD